MEVTKLSTKEKGEAECRLALVRNASNGWTMLSLLLRPPNPPHLHPLHLHRPSLRLHPILRHLHPILLRLRLHQDRLPLHPSHLHLHLRPYHPSNEERTPKEKKETSYG